MGRENWSFNDEMVLLKSFWYEIERKSQFSIQKRFKVQINCGFIHSKKNLTKML